MRKLILGIGIALLLGIGYLTVRAQYRNTVPAMSEALPRAQPIVRADVPPVFTVSVDPDLDLDPETRALCEQIAARLSRLPAVPDDRLRYYAAVNNPPAFEIHGWKGIIDDVTPQDGGFLVTVRVNPILSSLEYGPATYIESDYSEMYRVNGGIQYVGFLDPNGWAGLMPPSIYGL